MQLETDLFNAQNRYQQDISTAERKLKEAHEAFARDYQIAQARLGDAMTKAQNEYSQQLLRAMNQVTSLDPGCDDSEMAAVQQAPPVATIPDDDQEKPGKRTANTAPVKAKPKAKRRIGVRSKSSK